MSRRTIMGVAALGILLAGLAVGLFVLTRQSAPPPLPDPNGFDVLVAAAEQIDHAGGWEEAVQDGGDLDVLRGALETNRGPLESARAALDLDSRVPMPRDQQGIESHMDRISSLRRLARLMVAAAKVNEHENRPDEAIAVYIDLIRLGHACMRGGVMVDMLVGVAIEQIGLEGLIELAPTLDRQTSQSLIERLTTLELQRESFESVFVSEQQWQRAAFPWSHRIMLALSGQRAKLLQPALDAGAAAYRRAQAKNRMLLLDLAVRNYQQEHHAFPAALEEVTDSVPAALHRDPYSDGPLRYQPREGDFMLYSVGPDGKDDRGRPTPENASAATAGGDLPLRSSSD